MTYKTQAVRQGIETTDHKISKMLIISTALTILSLGYIALV